MLSFSFPFSSSVRASSSSTEPNSWTSLAAVFSPTPGTPGMLSEVSPLSATYSRYFDGGSPKRSSTAASSIRAMSEIPRRLNRTAEAAVRTSWKKSRSAVTIVGLDPLRGRPDGERADRVVRLVIGHEEHGDPQGLHDLLDQSELRTEVLRRLAAPGLVLRVHREPGRRPADVEGHGDQVGALLREELDQHRGEPVDGVRHLSRRGREGAREGEERPVRERVAVEDEEPARLLGGWVGGGGRHGAMVAVTTDERAGGSAATRSLDPNTRLRRRGRPTRDTAAIGERGGFVSLFFRPSLPARLAVRRCIATCLSARLAG